MLGLGGGWGWEQDGEGLTESTTDQIDGVVVGEVHCRPAQPEEVDDEEGPQTGESICHEEELGCCGAGMQGWKGAKHQWRCRKGGSVQVDAKQLVNSR